MDIEGFVRARIDDYTYDDLADILAVRIREYKNISEDNSVEMAKAVIDELFSRDLTQNIILVSLKDIHNIEMYLDTDVTVKFGDAIYFAEKVDHFVSMNINEAGTVKLDQWNPQHKQGSFYAK